MSIDALDAPATGEMTLIDRLLAEQRELTAVERFSQRHDRNALPLQAQYYQDLIPLTKPRPGEQYAFEVDMDKCTGCKACVSACHSLNGLEEHETWRDIGKIVGGFDDTPYQQTVTTACHHCVDPACANGCPVLAYEKDTETGIVRHLDDQCIGCQYCSLKCPYDVPKYSKSKGIVRKCDMCSSRLAAGEAPACVQACPTSAIRIVTVRTDQVIARSTRDTRLVPGAYRSDYTKPTTRFVTKRRISADARPANSLRPHPEHSHLPLVNMLTLTQIAVGLLLAQALVPRFSGTLPLPFLVAHVSPVNVAGLIALHLGLAASVLHLGQPLKAWRVFLGLRKSWLSREVAAFGLLPPLAIGAVFLPASLALPAAILGLFCVFTSIMVYADTHREFWSFPRTTARFYGTVAIFATAGVAFLTGTFAAAFAAAILVTVELGSEIWFLRNAQRADGSADSLSAQLILGKPLVLLARVLLAGTSSLLLITVRPESIAIACLCLAVSEWIERYQFFTCVVAHRMPGK